MATEDEVPSEPGDGDTAPGDGSGSTSAGARRRRGGGDQTTTPPPTRAAARKAAADEQKRAEARAARAGASDKPRSKARGSGKGSGLGSGSGTGGDTDTLGAKPVPKTPLGATAKAGRTATPSKTPSRVTSKTAAKSGARATPSRPGSRSTSKTAAKPTPKAAARSGNPKRSAAAVSESSRYTAPVPRSMKISPWYVPAAMFAFLGLGMLVIFLNYIGFPFGDPSNIRLFIGLGLILLGIITATQYH